MTTSEETDDALDDTDGRVLRDLESKYADVACPVHNTPPGFEAQPDGSIVERFCCEALAQIFHELQATENVDQGA